MSGMPTAADLAAIPLLAQLTPEAREALAPCFEVEQYTPGQRIVTQGDSGYDFFVVSEGRAAVTHSDRQLGYLEPGDYFGEMAIMGGDGRRTATVTAVSPVVAWTLFGISFRNLQISEPGVAEELERAMQQRASEQQLPG
jgi:CRP-like cAMP-binding protein